MAFDRGDIERVRDAADIVELARAVTSVKKSGRTVKAICPFHQEKTPSMSLDPARSSPCRHVTSQLIGLARRVVGSHHR